MNVLGETLRFYLTYNTGASGTKAQEMAGQFLNPNLYLLLVGCFGTFAGIAIIFTRNHSFKLWQKILIPILVLVAFGFIIDIVANSLFYVPSNHFVSWFTKLGGSVFFLGFIVLVKDDWLRLALTGCLSCGISNLLSHFYSPFAIVDFIYSPFLHEWLHLNICNIADILVDIFLILAILRFAVLMVSKARQKIVTERFY
ncbi:hypothetical protein EXU85_22525 [Spirosoma sp. KCTC 42546]|uniref:hypothetical protein n=1 Tax=Spirosoma sp. KCTC 42546 TaxID=2520506 RepID=UPI001158309E|nr:hypothetical protein [Spirosoma sp. KCTC 42546]QDK81232.1 hypothetical protein EXU85_22525 [Spirosoma sp. KCTC 42546]